MVRAWSFILLGATLSTAYGAVTETFKQGRVHWKRAPSGQQYPPTFEPAPASSNKPEWLAALNASIAAGKIPNIPPSTLNSQGAPTYPAGTPDPCNWSNTGCEGPHDIVQAPDGWLGVQFDDGPTQASPTLTNFLSQNDIAATHFMIGSNILSYPDQFANIFKLPNQHIAVHTWSHQMSTTLSNEVMLAELGWTMQIIYDKTGKIPSWWRPPMGDIDNRIRAIAENVFGLTAVSWNADSNDWCMDDNGQSSCPGTVPGENLASITNYIDQTVSRSSKSPGLIMLEHELTSYSVNAFIQHTWPGVQKYGWKTDCIPSLFGRPWYANSFNSTTPNSSQSSLLKSARVPGGNSNGTTTAGANASSVSTTGTSTSGSVSSSTSSLLKASSSSVKTGAAVPALGGLSTASLLAMVGAAALAALTL